MQYPGPPLPPKPTARQRAEHDAAFGKWVASERERIARQRRLFAANLGPARADLQRAMLDRAWEFLEAGECEAADALLEFAPEKAGDDLLNEFFGG